MIADNFKNQSPGIITQNVPLIVLDSNVLVAGLCRREDSPSYKILKNIQEGNIPFALTKKLFLQYESVLKREKILELIDATVEEVNLILDALLAIAQKSEVYYLWRPNLPNESDNFVLESAMAASAIIITKNIKDFKKGQLKFPDLIIMTPQQFCDIYL
ncbi:MAG: putative toxin-antitoxin system toxin component, PIN family [candidate division KSB1 bacterium]|nr:putative toxin-antitoxin system toxin component, PIN family [candidate division KSB1 bacterium]